MMNSGQGDLTETITPNKLERCDPRTDSAPDNFSQKLRKVNRSLGLRLGCLDFCHTFGSQLAIKGESLYKTSQLLGRPSDCRLTLLACFSGLRAQ